MRRTILDLFNLQRVPLHVRSHQQQTLISADHADYGMGMHDFCRTQVVLRFCDKAKRAFTYCLKISYGVGQRGKTAPWPRLIGSIKTHAAIGATSENATIASRRVGVSLLPFAGHQPKHDFFCYGHVFGTLEDRPTVLCRPQATSGLADSGYAAKKSFFSPAQSYQQSGLVHVHTACGA